MKYLSSTRVNKREGSENGTLTGWHEMIKHTDMHTLKTTAVSEFIIVQLTSFIE